MLVGAKTSFCCLSLSRFSNIVKKLPLILLFNREYNYSEY